ncbi:MAG TPA: D-alanyl-D-alanine carboxypeptidase family protein [Acidocella sp.]|jgi:D-alanyl-D-alanine carboxypeptidase|nr:D-alanyl-D-alanine carboxypeptidase family protein [Acidocella sp.]
MGAGVKRLSEKLTVLLGLCMAGLFATQPADADTRHHYVRHHIRHHHIAYRVPHRFEARPLPPSVGFGPTSPGPSTLVMDAASGRVLSESGADIPRYPASLTKLMTLDLAFQALRDGRLTLDTKLPVSEDAAAVEPVKLGLRPGGTIEVRQAILAMTTMSANDAATALGQYLGGGSLTRVAEMMTLRAHALGMAQTHFSNPSGLPDPSQVTTARDMAILARDIVRNFPEDQHFFEVQSFNYGRRTIYSNNGMLKLYPGTTGMKTGYTDLARHNLVTTADRDGRVLIGVTLHEPSWGTSYTQMAALLNDGFHGRAIAPDAAYADARPTAADVTVADVTAADVSPAAPAHAAPVRVADAAYDRQAARGGWTAQLGVFKLLVSARIEAINAQRHYGQGVARIARLERHGHTLWTAQLAGLTRTGARQTCSDRTVHRSSCLVIAPSADHLASLPAQEAGRS